LKYIIPTIDVEAIRSLSKLGDFDKFILGQINDELYGATKIAEIINDFEGSGTFYIDFAEKNHGIERLKKLSKDIIALNSDVQLHIHPQFIADKSRYLLNSYSKSEQLDIFNECLKVYEQSTGTKPVSFRAGGYSADNSTLEVLSKLGITTDSSYFHNHKWCRISELPLNKVTKLSSVYEVPVTIYQNHISYKLAGITFKEKYLTQKFDIDGCTKDELKEGFDSFNKNDVRIIILFMHSYSLIKWSSDYKKIYPDEKDINKLKFILEYASNNNYKIESIKNITPLLDNYINDNSILPQISTERNLIKSGIKTIGTKYRNIVRGK
jgi:hypothetical protein